MDLRRLRERIAGEVVARGDERYEAARRDLAWNRRAPDGRPRLLVRVGRPDDVAEAIRFARESGLRVTVRAGGHHWSGTALREDVLVLDLSRLDAVTVDPVARRAAVQPAVTNRELAARLAPQRLAFPYGHCPTVALSGYVLGGGLGWNGGAWGPASDHLAAVELVTASGEIVLADASHEPDLLWAARGAGPAFFAVATRFHLSLEELPRALVRRTSFHPLAAAAEVAGRAAEIAPRLPAWVEVVQILAAAPPPLAAACAADNGMVCALDAVAFAESETLGREALAPFESDPVLAASLLTVPAALTTWDELFDGITRAYPENHRYRSDTFWSDAAPEQVAGVLRDALGRAPSAKSLALLAPSRARPPQPGGGAFSSPGRQLAICYAVWDSASDDEVQRSWHAAAVAGLEPLALGHYVGEADLDAAPARLERCFAPDAWQRLQLLRARWDPDGLFLAPGAGVAPAGPPPSTAGAPAAG